MTDVEKLDALTKHLTRIAPLYGLPRDKVRSLALEILHSDSDSAKAIFAVEGFFRDTFCDDWVIGAMGQPELAHLFTQTPEPVEKTKEQSLEEFFKSDAFTSLDPVKRAQLYDSMTAEARAAQKEWERKAVAEAVRVAASRISDFHTWSPERRSQFADKIRAAQKEKAA